MGKPQAKILDVARHAGLSAATVSRALTAPEKVSRSALEKVRLAVEACGYVPHGAARALRSRRSRSIGVLIPTLDNAIFASATHALQRLLQERGYTLLVASHEYDPKEETSLATALIERGVDGLVLVGLDHSPELFALLKTFNTAYILTWVIDPSGEHPYIGFRNREATGQIAKYLLDIGHREFAMIAGKMALNDRARDRLAGVQDVLEMHGLRIGESYIREADYTFDAGREAMRSLLQLQPRPTAVICGNDILAIGAMHEAKILGVHVPKDVSVTGFDDLPISSLISPALTTVRVPTTELGQMAGLQLLAQLERNRDCPAGRSEVSVSLVLRGSTAPPRQAG